MEENAGHSNTEADGKAWTSLWSMQVLSKIKVFLWRLAQHSLPTSDLLNHRNMSDTRMHVVWSGGQLETCLGKLQHGQMRVVAVLGGDGRTYEFKHGW